MIRCMVDTESAAIENVEQFLGEIQAPPHYKNEDAIQKYLADAKAKELDKAALDPDLARITCLAFRFENERDVRGAVAKNEAEEKALLTRFWHLFRTHNGMGGITLVGFNIWGHDWPLMVRRSQYLGVDYPRLRSGRYAYQRPQIVDLMDVLTMDGHQKFKMRSRAWWLRRVGIAQPEDAITGADVPAMIAVGNWDAVLHHCKADIVSQVELAKWCGVWEEDKYFLAA